MSANANGQTSSAGKGKRFFDQADQLVGVGNWDYAIEMYLQGIRLEPKNMERGHAKLRETGLKRTATGGKKPGMMDAMKRRKGKDPLGNLINASYLLAREPGSASYMLDLLHAANDMKLGELKKMMCHLVLETQKQASKPNRKILAEITDAFMEAEDFLAAISACQMAANSAPNDAELADKLRELSAKYTLAKGKYGQEGDFTKGVKDMDAQRDGIEADSLVQSKSYIEKQIEKTKLAYLENPEIPGKINSYIDALMKPEQDEYDEEAIQVLTKAHGELGAYQFKMRQGDVKIRQMQRHYRMLHEAGKKEDAIEARKKLRKFELVEFAERTENYPTDMGVKFELGKRQLEAGLLDEAIGSLQQAQKDPRRHITAATMLGQAFAKKGWIREASETFEKILAGEMTEEKSKPIRYGLGQIYEKLGELEKAQNQFSTLAQIDFNYKDVRERLNKLRENQSH